MKDYELDLALDVDNLARAQRQQLAVVQAWSDHRGSYRDPATSTQPPTRRLGAHSDGKAGVEQSW